MKEKIKRLLESTSLSEEIVETMLAGKGFLREETYSDGMGSNIDHIKTYARLDTEELKNEFSAYLAEQGIENDPDNNFTGDLKNPGMVAKKINEFLDKL